METQKLLPSWMFRFCFLCCVFLGVSLYCPSTPTVVLDSLAHAKPKKLTVRDVLLLKQVGFSEAQIIQQLKKAGMLGKFVLRPTQYRMLQSAGFSKRLLRLMQVGSKPQTPVTLRELQGWLQQKKPEAWIRQQLLQRNILSQQFGPLTVLTLRRLGASIQLLQLIHKLKRNPQARPTPPRPSTPKPSNNLPIMPGLSFDFVPKPKPPTPSNPAQPNPTAQPLSRWGRGNKPIQAPLTVREQRIAQRQGVRVSPPANRIYQHTGNQFLITVPQGWHLLEDIHPESGHFELFLTPETETRPQQLQQGISISVLYIDRSQRFLATRSLLQISRVSLQSYLSRETGIQEVLPLGIARFHGLQAATVTLSGKERGQQIQRKTEHIFLKNKTTILHVRYFARSAQFAAFASKAKQHLKTLRFLDMDKARRDQRLQKAMTVQAIIQQNMKSVVSISVPRKQKNGKMGFRASGTGFVVTSTGYVLTNHHVAISSLTGKHYPKYILNWDRGTRQKSVEARFVAAHYQYPQRQRVRLIDPNTGRISVRYQRQHIDIALLKIIQPGTYTAVKLKPIESGMLGDTVVAMGFPLEGRGIKQLGNEDITATTGRVSRLVRMGTGKVNEIQHTAKIAGGNSGGPLFDVHTGGVIGINTWVGIFDKKLSRPGMGLGYYYALPINLAWQFFPDYIEIPAVRHNHLRWYELGRHWLSDGRHTTAKRAFLRSIRLQPNFAPAYAQLSALYIKRALRYNNDKRFRYLKIARRWADRGLKHDLQHVELMSLLAQITIYQKEWQTANYLINKVSQARPNEWSVRLLRAVMHTRKNQIPQALQEANHVIRLAGKLVPTGHTLRGKILYHAKRYFEGQQAYRQALQIDPDNLEAKLGEIMGYVRLNQSEEAIAKLARLQKSFPDEPSIFRTEMLAHTKAKQYSKGWMAFQKYFQRCMLRNTTPDAVSLYLGGLLAQRALSPKNRESIVWGLWGHLLQDHTTTPYAANAGILLASKAKKLGYQGITYGIIRLIRDLVQEPKLRDKVMKLSTQLQPQGLRSRELVFLLFRILPRWSPALIWKLFRLTPSIINKRTAIFLIRKKVPPKLVILMYRLSQKRLRSGMRPTRPTQATATGVRGSAADLRAIQQVTRLAFQALRQGDLDLWMSLYDPTGPRERYKRIFRNLNQALSNGRFVYSQLPRPKVVWQKLPRIGFTARYYFRARIGTRTKLYYWKLRRIGRRWVLY